MSDYFSESASLSEWVRAAKFSWAEELVVEDASKRDRLSILNEVANFPVVPNQSFSDYEIRSQANSFVEFIDCAGSTMDFALRLNPKSQGSLVYRNRGLSVPELLQWSESLPVDRDEYEYVFEPHVSAQISSILVVSEEGIFGEAVEGSILDLTSGNNSESESYRFGITDSSVKWSAGAPQNLNTFVELVLATIAVEPEDARTRLMKKLDVSFRDSIARGYYEAIMDANGRMYVIDFNRVLEGPLSFILRNEQTYSIKVSEKTISGVSAGPGVVVGRVRLLDGDTLQALEVDPGADYVLVSQSTQPRHMEMLATSSAVVTDLGGALSHAAIVARELGKPCVVGTRAATRRLRTGDLVEVDGTMGLVTILDRGLAE